MGAKITAICSCGREYQVDESFAGKTAKCKCGKRFTIPALPEFVEEDFNLEDSPPPVLKAPETAASDSLPARSATPLKIAIGALGGLVILFACLWLAGFEATEASPQTEALPAPQADWGCLSLLRECFGPNSETAGSIKRLADVFPSEKEPTCDIELVSANNGFIETCVPIRFSIGRDTSISGGLLNAEAIWFYSPTSVDERDPVVQVLYTTTGTVPEDMHQCGRDLIRGFGRIVNLPEPQQKRLDSVAQYIAIPVQGRPEKLLLSDALLVFENFYNESQLLEIAKKQEAIKEMVKKWCANGGEEYPFTRDQTPRVHFDLGNSWFVSLYFARVTEGNMWKGTPTHYLGGFCDKWTLVCYRRISDGWPVVSTKRIDEVIAKN